jgi:hypothetical protein
MPSSYPWHRHNEKPTPLSRTVGSTLDVGMVGTRIIADRIKRMRLRGETVDLRKVIRETLETIEQVVRFEMIRLFGCHNAVLGFALSEGGATDQSSRIADVELFLEIGASSRTMVSLISLGLSRTVAIRLNGARSEQEPELGQEEALEWLRSQSNNLDALGLSPLQVNEVQELLAKMLLRDQ